MTQINAHPLASNRTDVKRFGDRYTNSQPPLDQIRRWFLDQPDGQIQIEFVGLLSCFFPSDALGDEIDLQKRTDRFHEYLSLSNDEKTEIAKRTLTLIGHIDFVLEQKRAEERKHNIADLIHFRWTGWRHQWRKLRRSRLSSAAIVGWYFPKDPDEWKPFR